MIKINCLKYSVDKKNSNCGTFLIEPLGRGQAILLGNALRRTLLSDLSGFAITGIRINEVEHEFMSIESLHEDILELILNLKEIIFQSIFMEHDTFSCIKSKGFLYIKGPLIVTASMFQFLPNTVTIINPDLYLFTLINNSDFILEIDIEKNKGYRLKEDNRPRRTKMVLEQGIASPSTLYTDSLFMPIREVNYTVSLINDTQGHIKESLSLKIITNGSISPKRSILEALKILLSLFHSLFISPIF